MESEKILAINVLIEPEARVEAELVLLNAQLYQVDESGFLFDESHRPHLTLYQAYVRSVDLPALIDACRSAMSIPDRHRFLTADLEQQPGGTEGYSTWYLMVQRDKTLLELHKEARACTQPYALHQGSKEAFYCSLPQEQASPSMLRYVETFDQRAAGAAYKPHFTLGVGQSALVKTLVEQPFGSIAFTGRLAVYQTGHYGTARKLMAAL